MKHFRLRLILYIAAIALTGFGAGVSYAHGFIPQAILLAMGCIVASLCTTSHIRTLIRTMSSFVGAIEANDATLRISSSDDPELREMSEAMNRIATIYGANVHDLETRKLYYDRILRIMTHEMRNAITPVIAISSDMTASPDHYRGDDMTMAAELISEQSRGIKRFLDTYYELTHLPQPELCDIDAAEFISKAAKVAAARAGELGLSPDTVTYTVAKEMTFSADRDMVMRAATNLLRNALEAVAGTEKPTVELTMTHTAGYTVITVTDNGPGISEKAAENLFQPFFSTKPGGSGIGLCLSRQIARLHNGDLRYSGSHRGTTFTLTLAT